MHNKITLFFAMMSAPVLAGATGTNLADTTRILDEVTVVESAAKAPVPLLPLDVRIINNSTIENSTATNLLPVLQNRVPGMFVTVRSLAGYGVSGGAAGSVSIRGVGGGNKVLFLIDGQPQWAGIFGHSLPDTYVTNDVQRVEVVSGPSSLLYGSGAMGGSVNLITRRPEADGVNGKIRLAGGSFGTVKAGGRIGYKKGGLRALAAASYERSDGNRAGLGYWLANQYASMSYDFNPHWEIGVNGMVTETRADNPGEEFRTLPLNMWAKQLRTTASLFVKNRYSRASGGLQAYYNWGKHDIDDGLDSHNAPRTFLFHSKDFNMGATLYQALKLWRENDLSLGIDFKHWGGKAHNTDKTSSEESPIVDKHVNEVAAYAMMQQAFCDNFLSFNGGIRFEHSSQFGSQWVPQAGFILRPIRSHRIKFSYGRGFRSPNIRELYMYPPHNPDLKPELMDNYEVELRQWLLGSRMNFGVAFYYIKGENMIQQVRIDGRQRNVNTGKFYNRGVEIDFSYEITPQLSFTANYAYFYTETEIVGAPKNKLFGEISYTPGHWQFSVDAMGVWDLRTEKTTESYGLLNARVAYTFPLATPLTLFAKGENITAARYQINYGFPMPKATFMAGIEWKF